MSGKSVKEWTGAQRIRGRTSDSIAMAEYRNKLYIAYKGWDNNTLWINSFDGTTWEGEQRIQGRTSHAPALAAFRGRLYIAYKGWNDDTLWINSFDGTNWAGEQKIEGSPHDSPALTVYHNRLYVGYNQEDTSIWINKFDGTRWEGESRLQGRTNKGPALAAFGDTLYIAYKGYNNNTVWINRFDGTRWEGERRIPGQINDSPSLAAYRNYLFMVYKGDSNSIQLNTHRWIRWEGDIALIETSDCSPSVTVFGTKLFMAFKAADSRIWIDTFDGLGWEGERMLSHYSINSPAMTVFKGRLFVAHRERRSTRIQIESSSDGVAWQREPADPLGTTTDSPALTTHRVRYEQNGAFHHYEGRLFIGYRGSDAHIRVNHFDGSSWGTEQLLTIRSSHVPALAPYGNRLFVCYKSETDNTIWLTHHDHFKLVWDGSVWAESPPSWAAERQITGCETDASPALIAFRGELCVAYKRAGDTSLWWRRGRWSGSDIDWGPEERIPGRSTDSPALAAFGDQLFVIYKGARDHDIYFNVYDKRVGWLGEYDTTATGGLTNAALALACKEGIVYAAYKGWNDTTLWLNSYRIPQGWQPLPYYEYPLGFRFLPNDPHDFSGRRVNTENGEPLNHYYETEHLQVFWNESEPDEAVSPSDARLVAETIECAWEVFTNSRLSEGNPFHVDLDSPHLSNNPPKLSVRIQGVTSGNGGSSSPHLQISARGGVTGAASEQWGPHGYAGGTAPHELGHVMNKAYSWYYSSGGSGLWWINEGFVDVYRTMLDPFYPSAPDKELIGHLNLSDQSLLKTNYTGRIFWYSLAKAYTQIHDPETMDDPDWGFYQWREIPWELREMFRMVAGSCGVEKVRRIPGRDVLAAIQKKFSECHPEGRATPTCGDTEQPQCGSRTRSGCVPGDIGGEPTLYRLMPLAMSLIDEALDSFWSPESSTVLYRAFREFLERNFLTMQVLRSEAYRESSGLYRLKSFSAHYHVVSDEVTIRPGTIRVTITPEADLPDGEWAVAAFNLKDDQLKEVQPWTRGEGAITLSFEGGIHQNPVIIVAAFSLGFSYVSSRRPKLQSELSHYQMSIRTF